MAAQVGGVDPGGAAFGKAGGKRPQVPAVIAGAVQHDDDGVAVAGAAVFPVVQRCAVAGLILVQRRWRVAIGDLVEIHAVVLLTPDRRGEQGEQSAGQSQRP